MISQSGTMSPFYSDEYLESSHLLRKVILLFLLVIALALGLAILFREKQGYSPVLQKLFSDVCMAVVAGFGSRFIIRKQPGFVRAVASMSSYIVGLYVLGYASNWKFGMGPIVFWPKEVDWDGLAQMGIGIFLFLMVFRAWSRSKLAVIDSTSQSRRAMPNIFVRSRGSNSGTHRSSNAHTSSPRLSIPSFSWLSFKAPAGRSAGSTRSVSKSRARIQRGVQKSRVNRPANQKHRNVFRRRPHIQLALVEEHRCPYCLELVNRTDPRGTAECEVCHTLHHRDCWEITGTCQVPHLNT